MVLENCSHSPELEMLQQRLLRLGLSYGDFKKIKADPMDFAAWFGEICRMAKRYADLADEAWRKNQTVTAVELWHRASDYFHYTQLFQPYSQAKMDIRKASRDNFLKMIEFFSPKIERIEVPYLDKHLPGYLRVATPDSPLVILMNGLDSAKEVELFYFSEAFFKRGLSTLCIDAPGQGELLGQSRLSPEIESVISTVIDFITASPLFRPKRLGLFGVSFGGHLAVRSAALIERITACICLGSFFDAEPLAKFPPPVHGALCAQYGIKDDAELRQLYGQLSLAALPDKILQPLLIIHGGKDYLFDLKQAHKINDWASGEKEFWVYEDAEHVCSSCFDELLPKMGDWMFEHLSK